MSTSSIASVTSQELHDLHDLLMQPNEKTGKRLEPAAAVFLALVLVVDQRLEEICKAIKAIQPVKVDLMPPVAPQPRIVMRPPKDWPMPKAKRKR